jgi:hypothetical protein
MAKPQSKAFKHCIPESKMTLLCQGMLRLSAIRNVAREKGAVLYAITAAIPEITYNMEVYQ